jgi:hypothetical protein
VAAAWKKAELAKSYRYQPSRSRFSSAGVIVPISSAASSELVSRTSIEPDFHRYFRYDWIQVRVWIRLEIL